MKASRALPFRKTAACPASVTLLSFIANALQANAAARVKKHLEVCDFCSAELPLLAEHRPAPEPVEKVPEIPMNLRILAESILSQRAADVHQKQKASRSSPCLCTSVVDEVSGEE